MLLFPSIVQVTLWDKSSTSFTTTVDLNLYDFPCSISTSLGKIFTSWIIIVSGNTTTLTSYVFVVIPSSAVTL